MLDKTIKGSKLTKSLCPMIHLLDSSAVPLQGDALFPFAYEEVVGRRLGEDSSNISSLLVTPIVHLWRHKKAFIMGLRDRRLPHAAEAMKWLEQLGYDVIVRHSGGAAVPLDEGVLNLSILLPKAKSDMNFRPHFEMMVELIMNSVRVAEESSRASRSGAIQIPCEVNVREVKGSYCPGDYDLSIKGKKFCGIAQRRQTKSINVQAFIIVEGSGKERAELVKTFYQIAAEGESPQKYPQINEISMASLSELRGLHKTSELVSSTKVFLEQIGLQLQHQLEYESSLLQETASMISTLKQRYNPS